MGIIRKYNFSVSTRAGGYVSEIVEVEIEDNITETEIEKIIELKYRSWLCCNINTNWTKVE